MSSDRIARVIRALRHHRDWTQRELGERGGCTASVTSRLELHGAMFGRLGCRGRTARAWLHDPDRSTADGLLLLVPL